jgi:predicted ATP-dependent serine protease
MDCSWSRGADFKPIRISSMKDWNDAYKAGVNIRTMADKVNAYKGDNVVPLHGAPQTGPQLLTRCAADIEPEPIDWIWDGRIARGKLTVIGGDPEEGKSQLGVYISATISRPTRNPRVVCLQRSGMRSSVARLQ